LSTSDAQWSKSFGSKTAAKWFAANKDYAGTPATSVAAAVPGAATSIADSTMILPVNAATKGYTQANTSFTFLHVNTTINTAVNTAIATDMNKPAAQTGYQPIAAWTITLSLTAPLTATQYPFFVNDSTTVKTLGSGTVMSAENVGITVPDGKELAGWTTTKDGTTAQVTPDQTIDAFFQNYLDETANPAVFVPSTATKADTYVALTSNSAAPLAFGTTDSQVSKLMIYPVFEDATPVLTPGWNKNADGQWCYVDATTNAPVTGWKQLPWSQGASWFYFNKDGIMLTGWQKLAWSQGTDWFYFDPTNGNMIEGWKLINNKWYHLNNNSGAMDYYWIQSKGKWYYLGGANDGSMKTGWQQITWSQGTSWFYFYSPNGDMAVNTYIGQYHVNGDGAWDNQ
jgi:glucan-binding YG repeat protein